MSVVESISSCRQVDLQGVFIGIWGGDTRDRLNHQDKRFWVVLGGMGSRYRVQTGGFVGILGWMVVTVVIPMVLVARWTGGGVLGWFPKQNVV